MNNTKSQRLLMSANVVSRNLQKDNLDEETIKICLTQLNSIKADAEELMKELEGTLASRG